MKPVEYQYLKDFFSSYACGFVQQADDPEPFNNKITHTANVCENIRLLAESKAWDIENVYKALAAALLHDIGRFSQYQKYGTFSDARSENHGTLGAKIIKQQDLLKSLERSEQLQIIKAVALHNAFGLPPDLDAETRELTRMVRDADKLDIYRVMIELYNDRQPGRTSFITHHLPDDGRLSPGLIKTIENRQLIDSRHVKTLNDMRLLQISWIFDLNFPVSLQQVYQRGYISSVLSTLPPSKERDRVGNAAADYFKTMDLG